MTSFAHAEATTTYLIAATRLGSNASRPRADWRVTASKIHSGAGLASSLQRKAEAASAIVSSRERKRRPPRRPLSPIRSARTDPP
jgi:hypothetical protein